MTSKVTKLGLVLQVGGSGAWDEGLVESPCVFWDAATSQYAMVYVGYEAAVQHACLGLAFANSPTGPWTKYGSNPILSGSGSGPDAVGCSGPTIWIEGGVYYLYYIGLTSHGYEAGTKTTCLATATSLTGTWTRSGSNPLISPYGSGWRQTAIWQRSIVKVASTYYMFFNATGAPGDVESIGYATASAITGPWTVDDTNSPVLSKGASGWDSSWVGDPQVFWDGTYWLMAYYGYTPDDARDGYAWTTSALFPLGWTKFLSNPVIESDQSYDYQYAHKPAIFIDGTTRYHYYTAVGSLRQIALALDSCGILSLPVAAGADDTRCTRTTADPEVHTFAANATRVSAGFTSSTARKVGSSMRFVVAVPPGATIDVAEVTLKSSSAWAADTVNSRLWCEAIDDSPQITTDTALHALVPTTKVDWDAIGDWEPGLPYPTPSLIVPIQEVISRAGWHSGHGLTIVWEDFEGRSTANSNTYRAAYSRDASATNMPVLYLEWHTVPIIVVATMNGVASLSGVAVAAPATVVAATSGVASLSSVIVRSLSILAVAATNGVASVPNVAMTAASILAAAAMSGTAAVASTLVSSLSILAAAAASGVASLSSVIVRSLSILAAVATSGAASVSNVSLKAAAILAAASVSGVATAANVFLRAAAILSVVSASGVASFPNATVSARAVLGVTATSGAASLSNVVISTGSPAPAILTVVPSSGLATIPTIKVATPTRLTVAATSGLASVANVTVRSLSILGVAPMSGVAAFANVTVSAVFSPLTVAAASGTASMSNVAVAAPARVAIDATSGSASLPNVTVSAATVGELNLDSMNGAASVANVNVQATAILGVASVSGTSSSDNVILCSLSILAIDSTAGLASFPEVTITTGVTPLVVAATNGAASLSNLTVSSPTIFTIAPTSGVASIAGVNILTGVTLLAGTVNGTASVENINLSAAAILAMGLSSGVASMPNVTVLAVKPGTLTVAEMSGVASLANVSIGRAATVITIIGSFEHTTDLSGSYEPDIDLEASYE